MAIEQRYYQSYGEVAYATSATVRAYQSYGEVTYTVSATLRTYQSYAEIMILTPPSAVPYRYARKLPRWPGKLKNYVLPTIKVSSRRRTAVATVGNRTLFYQSYGEIAYSTNSRTATYQSYGEVTVTQGGLVAAYQAYVEIMIATPPDANPRRRQGASITRAARKIVAPSQAASRRRREVTSVDGYSLATPLLSSKKVTQKLRNKSNFVRPFQAAARRRRQVTPFASYSLLVALLSSKKVTQKLRNKSNFVRPFQAAARRRREVTSFLAYSLPAGILASKKVAHRPIRVAAHVHKPRDFRRLDDFSSGPALPAIDHHGHHRVILTKSFVAARHFYRPRDLRRSAAFFPEDDYVFVNVIT